MTLHVFVDESRRNKHYLLAAALVEPGELHRLRKLLRGMLLPGQREVHFKKETPSRRKAVISRLVDEPLEVWIYHARCSRGEERARRLCVAQLIEDSLDIQAQRLVLDSRAVRDEDDRFVIRRALGKWPRATGLVYEHLDSTKDELLWIADAVAWCYGAGGDWHRRIEPILAKIVDLRDKP
ncbi:hypothetical protein [Actinokineospora sp. NBRC 105648]|uniref:hypothetical protein n=1 Tax=Actinokineospora sp. NBRC 105648 TaxID=3032206 RepID=UPI0024A2961A|nr:hypothetical protein [Actinokineospora sp. NBRC 105648]GLZ37658.1 hypothetical protein Acsp05_12830 [Actinokineospora sp. NBRC 105648]